MLNVAACAEDYFREFGNALLCQDACTIVDLRLKYVPADARWSAASSTSI